MIAALCAVALLGAPQETVESSWAGFKPGTSITVRSTKTWKDGGQETYEVTQRIVAVDANQVQFEFRHSSGGVSRRGEDLRFEMEPLPQPPIEEKVLGTSEVKIGQRSYECTQIELIRTEFPQCGNSPGKSVTVTVLCRSSEMTANGGVLRRTDRTITHLKGGGPRDERSSEQAVLRLDDPMKFGGRSYSCVVVETRTTGSPEVETVWKCPQIPLGWGRWYRTGLSEHENGRIVTEIDQRMTSVVIVR